MITKRKYPWYAKQTWEDILFLHWRVPPKYLSSFIPSPLLLDIYDNSAWVSIVSFQAKESRLRILEKVQYPTFHQINIRTYVKLPGNTESGVYFFSLYANNLFAVLGGKSLFCLPFNIASSVLKKEGAKKYVNSHSKNFFRLKATYEPQRKAITDKALAAFLTERYYIWNQKGKRLIKIPIIHPHWHLQQVKIHQLQHQFLHGTEPTITHYSVYQQAHLFPYESVLVMDRLNSEIKLL